MTKEDQAFIDFLTSEMLEWDQFDVERLQTSIETFRCLTYDRVANESEMYSFVGNNYVDEYGSEETTTLHEGQRLESDEAIDHLLTYTIPSMLL